MIEIIYRNKNYPLRVKYKLKCRVCHSIILMDKEDFGNSCVGKVNYPTFTCPVCGMFYDWIYKNDKKCFKMITFKQD